MIQAIIFDFGGVVAIEPSNMWEQAYARIEKKFGVDKDLLASIYDKCKQDAWIGELGWRDVFTEVCSRPEYKHINPDDLLKELIQLYKDVSGRFNPEVLKIIDGLKQQYKVGLITNTERECAEMNEQLGLYSFFEYKFVSTELKLRKPDANIFEYASEKMNVAPERAVFMDNTPEWAKGATKVGMNSIVFRNPEQMKIELRNLGVNL